MNPNKARIPGITYRVNPIAVPELPPLANRVNYNKIARIPLMFLGMMLPFIAAYLISFVASAVWYSKDVMAAYTKNGAVDAFVLVSNYAGDFVFYLGLVLVVVFIYKLITR